MARKGLFVVLSVLSSHNHITTAQFNPGINTGIFSAHLYDRSCGICETGIGKGPTDPTRISRSSR